MHQVYRSLEKTKSLGLVKSRIDDTKYPHRNLVSLTEKVGKTGAKVMDIVSILDDEK